MLLPGCRRQLGEACKVLALPEPTHACPEHPARHRCPRKGAEPCRRSACCHPSRGSVAAGWDRLMRVRQPCSLESWLGSWEQPEFQVCGGGSAAPGETRLCAYGLNRV